MARDAREQQTWQFTRPHMEMDSAGWTWTQSRPYGHMVTRPYGHMAPLLVFLRCLPSSVACSSPLPALPRCLFFSVACASLLQSFLAACPSRCNDFESHRGLSGAILWVSWVILVSSWGHHVAILAHLGAILGHFGTILWSFSNSLELLGVEMRSKSTNINCPKGLSWL